MFFARMSNVNAVRASMGLGIGGMGVGGHGRKSRATFIMNTNNRGSGAGGSVVEYLDRKNNRFSTGSLARGSGLRRVSAVEKFGMKKAASVLSTADADMRSTVRSNRSTGMRSTGMRSFNSTGGRSSAGAGSISGGSVRLSKRGSFLAILEHRRSSLNVEEDSV